LIISRNITSAQNFLNAYTDQNQTGYLGFLNRIASDDFNNVIGDNFKAKKIFNWKPVNNIDLLIKKMIKHEMNKYKTYDKN
jgi:GDP-D-mannose dehydratase